VTGRRGTGESSIGKEADGRWHGYVSVGRKANGRRDRRHVQAGTRAEVVAKVRELEKRRDAGVTAASGTLTVAGWLDLWLDGAAASRVRPRTLESYRQVVTTHIVPAVGHHRLARLQPEHVEQLHRALLDKGLSPATVLRAHRVLARALRVAEQRGRVARNVCTLVDAPSAGRSAASGALTPEETRKVLDAARGRRNGARWAAALGLGLRQSEALALRWSDVDLEAGSLTVNRSLHRVTGQGIVFAEPKTERSRRRIALPRPLVDLLRAHRTAQLAERLRAGNRWEDGDLVFAQPNGRPLDKHSDWEEWRALLAAAGVRVVRLHDARHSAATTLLALGVPVRVVADMLGHAQTRTTQDTYQHVLPALARDAADRIGAELWGR
jgi:integrase